MGHFAQLTVDAQSHPVKRFVGFKMQVGGLAFNGLLKLLLHNAFRHRLRTLLTIDPAAMRERFQGELAKATA